VEKKKNLIDAAHPGSYSINAAWVSRITKSKQTLESQFFSKLKRIKKLRKNERKLNLGEFNSYRKRIKIQHKLRPKPSQALVFFFFFFFFLK
jgi:hypothetical protein